jgi:hypothetical protein
MTPQQAQALRQVAKAVLDAVKAGGNHGAPAGPLYAALMGFGCSLNQFQQIMSALVRTGKVRTNESGTLYWHVADL